MLSTALLSLLLSPLACTDKADDPTSTSTDNTEPTDPGDTDLTDSTTPTDDTSPPQDTSTPTDTDATYGDPEVTNITWQLHDEIESIILVSWEQAANPNSHIEYRIGDEAWMTTPTVTRDTGTHQELLLGVPYDTELTFRIVNDPGSGPVTTDDHTATTGPLPEGVPVPLVQASVPDAWHPTDRWLLIGMAGGGNGWDTTAFWKLIIDRTGRIVWAHPTPDRYRTFYMQPSIDRTEILWEENTFWTDFDEGAGTIAHRMTIDGTINETFPLPGMHHTFLEIPNGAILWGGIDGEHEVLRERLPDGTVREIWNCTDYWEAQGYFGECDGNALYWNEDDQTIYFSSDAGHSVTEVDYTTGEVIHLWGQLPTAWPFADPTTTFWKQHSPTRTPEGNLLLSSWTNENNHELLAREYEIDEEDEVLREVWSCGQGSGVDAHVAGEAHRLENGNTLLNYGGGGHLREYTSDCEVVWQLDWEGDPLLGRATYLDDLYSFAP